MFFEASALERKREVGEMAFRLSGVCNRNLRGFERVQGFFNEGFLFQGFFQGSV